eukprot:SAG25_NODE_4101_length_889_cov_1.562025_1_plen_165_part_00
MGYGAAEHSGGGEGVRQVDGVVVTAHGGECRNVLRPEVSLEGHARAQLDGHVRLPVRRRPCGGSGVTACCLLLVQPTRCGSAQAGWRSPPPTGGAEADARYRYRPAEPERRGHVGAHDGDGAMAAGRWLAADTRPAAARRMVRVQMVVLGLQLEYKWLYWVYKN